MHTSLLAIAITATTALASPVATLFSKSEMVATVTSSPAVLAEPLFPTPLIPEVVPSVFPTAVETCLSVPASVSAVSTGTATLVAPAHASLTWRPRIPIPVFTRLPKYRTVPTFHPATDSETRQYMNHTEQKYVIDHASVVAENWNLTAPAPASVIEALEVMKEFGKKLGPLVDPLPPKIERNATYGLPEDQRKYLSLEEQDDIIDFANRLAESFGISGSTTTRNAIYWVEEAERKFVDEGSIHNTVGGDIDKFKGCLWCLLDCAYCPSWTEN